MSTKPTHEEIINSIKPNYTPIHVRVFESIESFTLVFRFKNQAEPAARSINNHFGQWVHASVHDEYRQHRVSVGYRSKELVKCKGCGWLDGMHSRWCKSKTYEINGYDVVWNSGSGMWVVSHDEIGAGLAEFEDIHAAQDYCEKG